MMEVEREREIEKSEIEKAGGLGLCINLLWRRRGLPPFYL